MYIEDENFVSSEEYKKHLEMLPFDICELSNLHFSVDEMLEYYNTVDQHFQHLK